MSSHHPAWTAWTTCPVHAKKSWPTRKAARHTLRSVHPGSGMQVYKCQAGYGWHIGNPWGHEREAVPRVPPREVMKRKGDTH